jgi:hypothetical protein
VQTPREINSSLSRHRFVILFGLLLLFYIVVPVLHHVRDRLHPSAGVLAEGILFIAVDVTRRLVRR